MIWERSETTELFGSEVLITNNELRENLTNLLFLEILSYHYLLLELNVACELHLGNLGGVTDDISTLVKLISQENDF